MGGNATDINALSPYRLTRTQVTAPYNHYKGAPGPGTKETNGQGINKVCGAYR
jgi:hypothetical protein